jgi:hypothetical protein
MPTLFFCLKGDKMAKLSERTKMELRGSIKDPQAAEEVIKNLENDLKEDQLLDFSVNDAKTYIDHEGSLILQANKKHTGQVSGNFNGSGSGNKPICGLTGLNFEGIRLSKLDFRVESDVEIRTDDADADQQELGISYNILIDSQGNGDINDLIVLNPTFTLNGVVDKYGESGASASLTDFDIRTLDQIYVVGVLLPGDSGAWFDNPHTLDEILAEYPNAVLTSVISTDGGHPAGIKLPAIMMQIGGSGNSLKAVTAITNLKINGIKIV